MNSRVGVDFVVMGVDLCMKYFREPVSGFTHLFGAVCSLVGMVFLILKSDGISLTVAYIIFGISMFLLFASSAGYHLANGSERLIDNLRRVDHSMIYVFIAGTYTPLLLEILSFEKFILGVSAVWISAAIGIVLKLFFTGKFRVISTLVYLCMGWACLPLVSLLYKALGLGGVVLMVIGGIFYTIGAVVYAAKWPLRDNRVFGFHEIFHILVLAGAASMFAGVYVYL